MKAEDVEKDLLLNFKDFWVSGDDDLIKKRYNPAVSSYFKALAVLCDLNIYKRLRILPKNHTERFSILKANFPKAYSLMSKLFRKYTESYDLRMERKDALMLKENVKKLKDIFQD